MKEKEQDELFMKDKTDREKRKKAREEA